MGHFQDLLFLFLLGSSSLTMAQHLYCHKGVFMTVEDDPRNTFNWTTEKVETCDNKRSFCQETMLMITAAGDKTAILSTKGCVSAGAEAVTFIQHSPPPGLVAVSYTNYCEDSLCNNRENVSSFWRQEETSAPSVPALHCPTCVALGTCLSAPSLPCPSGTTRCYQGKLTVSGGGINSTLEVKGCTATAGCRLLARILRVGPMLIKEECPQRLLLQARQAASRATCPHFRLEVGAAVAFATAVIFPFCLRRCFCSWVPRNLF